jgi:7,8-dihydro-6-hydroxymethylpterin-pyrophosphokinase
MSLGLADGLSNSHKKRFDTVARTSPIARKLNTLTKAPSRKKNSSESQERQARNVSKVARAPQSLTNFLPTRDLGLDISLPVVWPRRILSGLVEAIKPAESIRTEQPAQITTAPQPSLGKRGVLVALGSNIGDRLSNIENACREIDKDPDMRIVHTSALYETEPMYVEDQDPFLNGVCEVSNYSALSDWDRILKLPHQLETGLSPGELLDRLQAIEKLMGRVKVIENGPRNIDLDILLYKNQVVDTERLQVPHARMLEREFVLRPLCEYVATLFHLLHI